MRTLIEMLEQLQCINSDTEYKLITDISFQNKMYEEIRLNQELPNDNSSSKPEIDWNFVLGLFFGIGYLIFASIT
jgi:hypothetical protein